VKCSGNPGTGEPCSNCGRLELACPFAEKQPETIQTPAEDKISRIKPSHSHTEAGTLRKRAQRACSQCHSQKTKCSGDLPRCKRCEAGDLKCEYTPAKRRFANVRLQSESKSEEPPTPTPTTVAASPPSPSLAPKKERSPFLSPRGKDGKPSECFPLMIDTSHLSSHLLRELLTRKHIILRHLEAYFEHIYWLPCMGYFHPETARRQVHEGTFDAPTAAAVCAISSFFVNPGDGAKEFSLKCLDEVEFFFFRNIHKFSEAVLIPYSLIISFNFLNGSFAKVWQTLGIAIRLVTGMQLNWDYAMQHRSFQDQERLRRVAWQFFVLDRLLAGGYEEYISCRAEIMKIRLPCQEEAFWENKPITAERLHEKPASCKGIGLHGLNVRLADINHRIQSWSKRLTQRVSLEPSKVMEDINNFQNELTWFHASIPNDVRLSDQSLSKFMASSERVGYVYFHTHLSVGHIDLYRFALPGILDSTKNDILRRLPPDFVQRARKQVVAHALCTGRFCVAIQDEMDRLAKCGITGFAGDATIAHMATQSLRVFLVAMQHEIYDDLTEGTTAPLWRFQQPDEAYIRSLITNGLFRVSEPWCPVLVACQQSHASNKAMFEEFERTRRFTDAKDAYRNKLKATDSSARLPGPHYILENANHGVAEQDQRARASEAAVAKRWFNEPKQQAEPIAYPPPDLDFDMEYGPPGIPMMLAVARNPDSGRSDNNVNFLYDGDREATALLQDKVWLNGGIIAPDSGQMAYVATHAGVPFMQIGSTDPNMMFPPPQPPPPPPSTLPHSTTTPFVPSQAGIYVDTWAAPSYDNLHSASYMRQPDFN
ncbi:unnamed protein product, partial [Clonostachys chloroleuca]